MFSHAYLALGSNWHEPLEQLKQAVLAISHVAQTKIIACSPTYLSKPLGPSDQPDFMNAVLWIETALSPSDLLEKTQAIEQQQHRVRTRHWGERTLDIDLLLYGDTNINLPNLTVPHPGILQRDFVLKPLLDIAPGICLPDGTILRDALAACPIYTYAHDCTLQTFWSKMPATLLSL